MNPKGRIPQTPAQRKESFFRCVEMIPFHSCWEWTAYINRSGYAQFKHNNNRNILAHRYSYLIHKTEIPQGLVVDHICRNRSCVNPGHLRVVTRRVNTLENSMSITAANKAKTHCKRGHPLVDGNIYYETRTGRGGRGACMTCAKANALARYYNARTKNKTTAEAAITS